MQNEIIYKKISKIRVTLAQDRTTVKFPEGFNEEESQRYLECVKAIKSQLVIDGTLRGSFLK